MNNQIMPVNETAAIAVTPENNAMLGVFASGETFQMAARMADAMSKATIVPSDYQGNPGNCMIAIDTAARMGISPMMVMQNLYVVHGRPAWSSQWIIAAINASKKYSCDLQFEYGDAKEDGGLSCVAWAMDKNGIKICGPKITMNMAKAEGWVGKNGSKWQTMPEVMISYRAASFFGRRNCPEITLGIYAEEEAASIPMETAKNTVPAPTAAIAPTPAADPAEVLSPIIAESPAKITKEQRSTLFSYACEVIGDGYLDTLKAMVAAEGFDKTGDITADAYDRIMIRLDEIADMKAEEHAPIPEDAPEA